MRFDRGTVDENFSWRATGLGERVEQVDPDALRSPAHISIVERLPGSIFWRGIDPAPARFQHMNDATDHAPIIDTRFAARIRRQVWFDLRKLRVRQPELIPIHLRSPSRTVNHSALILPTFLWV